MPEWSVRPLGELIELQRGHDLPHSERQQGDVPVVGSNGVVGTHSSSLYDGPGVMIGRSGVIGGAQYVTSSYWPLNTTLFVKNFRGNEARWVFYMLQGIDFRAFDSGSAQPSLNRNYVAGVMVQMPTLPEQIAIAEVLGALDDKISTNAKLIIAADELMHAQFRAAVAQGKEERLSDSAEFINGRAFTKDASGTGRVVIRIAELNSGIGGSTVFSDAEVPDAHVAQPGDVLFAWSGSLTLHRWFRPPGIVNQHIFKVIPKDGRPNWLVYELVRAKLTEFKAIAADKATTMGHIQRRHLDELVRGPSAVAVEALHPLMNALWAAALNAEQENLALAATRDALLPQLMSGKLRVKDAENLVSEVV